MTQDQWEREVLQLHIVAEMMRQETERLKPECKTPGDIDALRNILLHLEGIERCIRRLETPFL